jgi:hypothetical protein
MNAADIREIIRDVFGRHYKTEVLRNWVQFRCPLSTWTHQRGADSKPSAGISIHDTDVSIFNCFTCGNKGPISSLLQRYARFTGENLDDLISELEDEEYLGPRSIPGWEDRADPTLHLPKLNKDIYLGLYDSAAGHPYLRERGISDETAELLELRFDPDDPADGEPRILFPVYGLDGTLHGFSGRAINPDARLKVRDYHGLPKAFCVLGCHLIRPGEHKFVDTVEGLFDYARGWECGEPTVAVMHSTMTEAQIEIMLGIGLPTYLFYDNDDAGQKGVEIAGAALSMNQPVMRVRYPEVWIEDDSAEGGHWLKDPGELLPEEFQSMRADARLF